MRNFKGIFGMLVVLAISFASHAQQTTPRFGVGTNAFGGSNGVKYVQSVALNNTNDAAGADTIKLFGNVFRQYVSPKDSLKDSIVYRFKSLASCYPYDELIFNFYAGKASKKIRFSNRILSAFVFSTAGDSTTTLAANKRMRITFIFDGTKWLETGKVVQP